MAWSGRPGLGTPGPGPTSRPSPASFPSRPRSGVASSRAAWSEGRRIGIRRTCAALTPPWSGHGTS